MRRHTIAVIPGDGVGPEVTKAALRVLDAAESRFGFSTERTQVPLGADHYLETGELLEDAMVEQLRAQDAILFGAIGSPKVTPGILERGIILALRRTLEQAINLRPVRLYDGVPTPIAGLTPERCDLVIVRENTEGAYVAQGSTVHAGTPAQVAVQESVNTWYAVERAVDFAYRLASVRRKKLTLCHKTNVLVEAGKLWTAVMEKVGERYPDVETDYVHVDAMCMHLPVNPDRFDVVVTDNLFGDIVTDLGAVLQGGLGVAASGNLNISGSGASMFEPIHGSAPDIAGRGWANPAGACLSLAMMLGHLGEGEAAAAVESATTAVLADLPALAGEGMGASTQELGDRIAALVADGSAPVVGNSLMSQLAQVMSAPGMPSAAAGASVAAGVPVGDPA